MEEHLIEVHEELEKFYCSVCDLRFRTKKVFKAHGKEFHDFIDVKGRVCSRFVFLGWTVHRPAVQIYILLKYGYLTKIIKVGHIFR